MWYRKPVRHAAVLAMVLALGACTAAQRQVQQPIVGPEFILEINNPLPRAMILSFNAGGATTTLGTVPANETRRWAIPNQGQDNIRLVATNESRSETHLKSLSLKAGEVVRWEIRD